MFTNLKGFFLAVLTVSLTGPSHKFLKNRGRVCFSMVELEYIIQSLCNHLLGVLYASMVLYRIKSTSLRRQSLHTRRYLA